VTVPAWFVLLAVGFLVVRVMFGLASIGDPPRDEVGVGRSCPRGLMSGERPDADTEEPAA